MSKLIGNTVNANMKAVVALEQQSINLPSLRDIVEIVEQQSVQQQPEEQSLLIFLKKYVIKNRR